MATHFITLNNRSYTVFLNNGSTVEVAAMMRTANGQDRLVTNPVTLAKALAVVVEKFHAEALEMNEELDLNKKREAIRSGAWVAEAQDAEFNTRKCRLMIESGAYDAEHAEALEMNKLYGTMHRYAVLVASDEVKKTLIEQAHAVALEMNAEFDDEVGSIDLLVPRESDKAKFIAVAAYYILGVGENPTTQADTSNQTVARRNSLTHKIGMAFAGAALMFSGMTHAEALPTYPVDASRLSLDGAVTVSIDCGSKKVDVIDETTTAAFFSRQVKSQVWNICYGVKGTIARNYTFTMNNQVAAHNMVSNNSDRHPL